MSRGGTEYKKGDTVEGYKVLAELGRGAASIIYLVKDKDNHIWALKHVEKVEPKDQRFLDQAEAEYHVAHAMDHPAIRKIEKMIKRGKSMLSLETIHLYLLMELVDGISMESKPPKTFEEAVYIFEQTAEALHHMHTNGFVHADMKPNNIVVTAEDEVKLIDLGQSCRVDTVKERIQGTPDFIAPEQVHCRPITARTDVYNLGASMYWILTRRHIPTALGSSTSLLGKIDDNLIEKPKPAIELNPRIPAMLNDLIMHCLEIDPEKRPKDMKLVADKLNLIRAKLHAMKNGPAPETMESREDSAP